MIHYTRWGRYVSSMGERDVTHQTSATLKDGGNPRDQQNRMTRKAVNIIRHSRERGVIEDLTFA